MDGKKRGGWRRVGRRGMGRRIGDLRGPLTDAGLYGISIYRNTIGLNKAKLVFGLKGCSEIF